MHIILNDIQYLVLKRLQTVLTKTKGVVRICANVYNRWDRPIVTFALYNTFIKIIILPQSPANDLFLGLRYGS